LRRAMANEGPPSLRARRWTPPPSTGTTTRSAPFRSNRFMLRLIGIPVLALIGVFIYSGMRDRLVLPECNSDRAKKTLAEILGPLKLEPTRYEPLKTVSTTKQDVVCSAVLPLPDGATVAVDYTFYWQGNNANVKYSVARKPAEVTPPHS